MRSPNLLLSLESGRFRETSAWSCGLSQGDSSRWWEDGTNLVGGGGGGGGWSEEWARLELGVG